VKGSTDLSECETASLGQVCCLSHPYSRKTSGSSKPTAPLRQSQPSIPLPNGNIYSLLVDMMEIAANPSPVGSEIFALVALFVISLVVLLILRHYLPLRTTPAYLLVPIFFALWLPASIVLLVPIDLASNTRDQDAGSRGIWLFDWVLLISWRVCYWLTFALTWYVFQSETFSLF